MRISTSAAGASRRTESARPQERHAVAFAVLRILVVTVLLVCILAVVERNGSDTASTGTRAGVEASIATDLTRTSQASDDLETAFERAATIQDVGGRAAQFSTASATGTTGTGAYSTYLQRSLQLPNELNLRAAYQRPNSAWTVLAGVFGGQIVNPATPPALVTTSIAKLHKLHEARQAALAALVGLYTAHYAQDDRHVIETQHTASNAAKVAIGGVIAVGIALMVLSGRRASRRLALRVRVERDRATVERRTDFEARLQRSMALAVDEAAVVESVGHTLAVVGLPGAELLVAGRTGGHFTRTIAPSVGAGCGVERASDCPALRLRQRLEFPAPDAIDACAFLRARKDDVGQAVCIPVVIADETLSILRADTPAGEPLTNEQADWIAIVAHNTGEKISALRAFAYSQHEAATDPLTGLANRRSLEQAVATRTTTGIYAILFADIDHFKDLNDTYGHEIGDSCLQAFARVLNRATRPGDVCTRYGGEEFVVLLPDASNIDAEGVAQRSQTLLGAELANAHLPPFTVSLGIASTDDATSLEDVVRAADHAMFAAKAAGRNQIVTAVTQPESKPELGETVQ